MSELDLIKSYFSIFLSFFYISFVKFLYDWMTQFLDNWPILLHVVEEHDELTYLSHFKQIWRFLF